MKSVFGCFLLSTIIHAPFALGSSSPFEQAAYTAFHQQHEKGNWLSPKMTFDITLHGLLLWASLGFLMPIGMLIIKLSNREECRAKLRVYFYVHLIVQMLSVLLATAGAIMSIKTFENSFSNSHQRMGLALYGAIWMQAMLGFFRPPRGSRKRSLWYFMHWIFGTVICIVGILNIYTGLAAYKKRTKKSVSLWTILFTAEISFLAVLYLLQDKWNYIQKQGVILGEEVQVRPSDQESSQRDLNNNDQKDLWRQPCSKANALKNLFN